MGAGRAPVRGGSGDRGIGGSEGVHGPAFGVLVDVVDDRAMGTIVPDDPFVVVALPDFYAGSAAELVDLFGRFIFKLTNKLADRDWILRNRVIRSSLNFEDEVDMVWHDHPALDRDAGMLKTQRF